MEKTRVLIVDDDPNINQLIKLYLEKEGYETDTAMRGDDALNQFKKNPPHIVLLDLMLPGMDGWQVCREIRKISTIPIIMLTAKDETFDKVLGLELGA
ncbi:MAG: response regulator, partial [Candidatus Spyradocola sp.]|nr:response regulator [Candidatus Spyradocola sp.]